jgi:hypothetical protein
MTKRIFLTAAALALAAAVGCSRDEKAPAGDGAASVSPAAPESYMKDREFRDRLDGQVSKRGELAAARNSVVAQMVEMVEAKKKELGTDDEATIRAALEKDPAWKELYARCQDANAAIGENRQETMAIVRERLTRKK